MSKKISLKKTCSIYASELHLATMIFPYIKKELERKAIVKAMLENDIGTNIEKVLCHTNINSELKEQIQQIDWKQTNKKKIEQMLKEIEENLRHNEKVDIIVSGSNFFIDKINELIDLWTKVNFEEIANSEKTINIINCYYFKQNEQIDEIMKKHEYILRTTGIQELIEENPLKKAN